MSRFHGLDVVLVCGLPGAGKSEFAREHFASTGRRRVNRKEIRRLLYEMTRFGDPWKESCFAEHDEMLVKHVERRIIEHLLQRGEKVLVDNISVTAASRSTYVRLARQMGKRIGVIFLDTPVQSCLQRNRTAQDPVPENVISNLYASVEPPTRQEGFDEVLIVGQTQG